MNFSHSRSSSYISSVVGIITLMLNTPLVDPESASIPKAIPLKTFYSSALDPLDQDRISVYSSPRASIDSGSSVSSSSSSSARSSFS